MDELSLFLSEKVNYKSVDSNSSTKIIDCRDADFFIVTGLSINLIDSARLASFADDAAEGIGLMGWIDCRVLAMLGVSNFLLDGEIFRESASFS